VATRVEADVLIPGSGSPINNGAVVWSGTKIEYAGPIENAPPVTSADSVVKVPAVLPGLWDSHTHFLGLRKLSIEQMVLTSNWVAIVRATRDAEKALRAGFTSVRELGGFGVYLARAVNEGTIAGPHIYASATQLTPTAGHGDAHFFPLEMVHMLARDVGFPGPCDGVAECLAGVRKVLRLGASVVKVMASGGVMSELDSPLHQEFSDEELRAIVEEAGRAERIVAAHCHGKAGIMAALRAGAKTIEHGSYLDDEAAELMIEKEAMLVPTRLIVDQFVKRGEADGLPEFMLRKAREIHDRHREAIRLAIRRKVPIALGTDIGASSDAAPVYWGINGRELSLLVDDLGMTPLAAIEAATAHGPRTLGPQAPRSGLLREGYDADILAVSENPLQRIAALAEPERLVRVWKDGKLVVDRPFDGSA
jgi:imidazolonepropionase-like amidohydrolase